MYQRHPALERPAGDLFHDFMTPLQGPDLDAFLLAGLANEALSDQPSAQ
jgi:hypothetical protein